METRKQRLTIALLTLAVVLVISAYMSMLNTWVSIPISSDFAKFYASAQFLLEGRSIYTPVELDSFGPLPERMEAKQDTLHPNLNPPFQTVLFAPFGLLKYEPAYFIWSALSLMFGLFSVFLLVQATNKSEGLLPITLGLSLVMLLYFPTIVASLFGQLSLLIFLLVTIGWTGARAGKERRAGIALGLALSLKVFVGLFLVFFLVRRRWRLLGWMTGVFALCSLLAGMIVGPDTYRDYLQTLGSITWYGASWNASVMGFLTRILGGSENVPIVDLPWLGKAIAYALSGLLTALIAWLSLPRPIESDTSNFDLTFSLTVVAMLLISPLGWMYYFPILLIPATIAWRQSTGGTAFKVSLVLAWVLSSMPRWLLPAAKVDNPMAWFVWSGSYFYALVLITGILIGLATRWAAVPMLRHDLARVRSLLGHGLPRGVSVATLGTGRQSPVSELAKTDFTGRAY